MADRIREDVQSPYLNIEEFVGQTLIAPRELISRKVICSNVQTIMTEAQAQDVGGGSGTVRTTLSNQLQSLNFRLLSTSPGCLLNARVVLVLPMLIHHICGNNTVAAAGGFANYSAGGAHGVRGAAAATFAAQFAPRRNGILKACRSVTSTVNSTVSFSCRPSEIIGVMETMFDQTGTQTAVYNDPEESAWGNTDGACRAAAAAATAAPVVVNGVACPRGDLVRVRNIWNPADSDLTTAMVNKGFQARRADLRSGGGAEDGGLKPDYASTTQTSYYKYDYRSCLLVPPFKTFNTDIYSRSPTWLPYIDSLDLMLSFKTPNEVKAALFQAASMLEGGNTYQIQNWDIGFI